MSKEHPFWTDFCAFCKGYLEEEKCTCEPWVREYFDTHKKSADKKRAKVNELREAEASRPPSELHISSEE